MSLFDNVGKLANLSYSTVSGVYNPFSNKQNVSNSLSKLSESKIISIGNEINNISRDVKIDGRKPNINVTLPRIVVCGGQSSGKSGFLNNVLGMDFFPTGGTMVTRTPLEANLFKIEKNLQAYVEFGSYDDIGMWTVENKFNITTPVPLQSEINAIRSYISAKTIEICGPGMDISFKPIVINICSPYVPNLSLVDLPGLTLVACRDKGQPHDIKDRIEKLVVSYISKKNSIIVAVMAARRDLETDLGLALIKKYDEFGERTIGVLTKPDLMNRDQHIGDYLLNNNISTDLMLTYGYYVIKNRNDKEILEYDVLKGVKLEEEYFASHYEYSKSIYQDKLGIKNLVSMLTKILVSSISEAIPNVMADILALDARILQILSTMGEELPQSREGKMSVLNKYVTSFNIKFTDSIESRGNTFYNAGKKIKKVLMDYREKLMEIKPFHNVNIYSQKYYDDKISSFEGNHMANHTSPIQILEACMKDRNLRPILLLSEPSAKCVDNICSVLIDLIRNILNMDEFSQYPALSSCVMSNLLDKVISKQKIITNDLINVNILAQEAYIWTEDKRFHAASEKIRKEKDSESKIEILKEFLEAFYYSVKYIIADVVPKMIMLNIVDCIKDTALSHLFENIVTDDKIELLKEDPKVDKQRKYLHSIRNRITNVKNDVQKNLTLIDNNTTSNNNNNNE